MLRTALTILAAIVSTVLASAAAVYVLLAVGWRDRLTDYYG